MCIPKNWTVEMAQESVCSDETLKAEAKSLEGSDMWKVLMIGQFIYGLGTACVGPFGVRIKDQCFAKHLLIRQMAMLSLRWHMLKMWSRLLCQIHCVGDKRISYGCEHLLMNLDSATVKLILYSALLIFPDLVYQRSGLPSQRSHVPGRPVYDHGDGTCVWIYVWRHRHQNLGRVWSIWK